MSEVRGLKLLRKRRRLLVLIAAIAIAAAVLVGRSAYRAPRPDKPFWRFGLRLTDSQARRIEDWAERGRFLANNMDGPADIRAKYLFIRSVLDAKQWAQWAKYRLTPATCTNPWCPCHGRIASVSRAMGWIRRHLPPGWEMETDFAWRAPEAFATGRNRSGVTAGPSPSFLLYVGRSGRPVPRRVSRMSLKELGKSPSFLSWRAFASITGATPADEQALLSLFRQACAIDWGRVKHGLRADLRDAPDPRFEPLPKKRRLGGPVHALFTVTNVGGDSFLDAPYLGRETPPPFLRFEVVTPDGAVHTLQSRSTLKTPGAPRESLGWGYTYWRTVDLMKYPGAAGVFSRPGAYKVKATYYWRWPNMRFRLATNAITIVLEKPDHATPAPKRAVK